jgi:phosphoadenosine phosphosulfate reductase
MPIERGAQMPDTKPQDVQKVAEMLKDAHPLEIMRWGVERLGAELLTLACSFGAEDVVLVDLLAQLDAPVEIFYLDTNLHFAETYQVRDHLQEKYRNLRFRQVLPELSLDEQAAQWDEQLWRANPTKCCQLRKVAPLRQTLADFTGWITGIRREQSPTRATSEVVEWDESFNMWKLNPLAYWRQVQVWDYIRAHEVPYNPLHEQNYPSIGCAPCTQPVQPGEDPRAGRWAGFAKTECGLHQSEAENG